MSRVYSENVIHDAVTGTADYIWAFYRALPATRIAPSDSAGFGGSLLDFFLNVYGTSDPYLPEEIDFTQSWSQWTDWQGEDTALHNFSSLESDWPPPQEWALQVDWNPLSQNSQRHRLFGRYRSRR